MTGALDVEAAFQRASGLSKMSASLQLSRNQHRSENGRSPEACFENEEGGYPQPFLAGIVPKPSSTRVLILAQLVVWRSVVVRGRFLTVPQQELGAQFPKPPTIRVT